ncbi:thioesterase domain-containing protein [Streptomyces sp. NPDC059913]|uniref:thioesterase domain-containing protein n=1 Tax=unclassified Streptomyces TaxID=2593676 RepID=UPI00365D31E8
MTVFRPRSGLEGEIGEIWTELLGHGEFGTNESFFRVGGTSFAAVRLLAELKRRFGYDIPLSELVHDATVAGIGMMLRGSATTRPGVLVPLNPRGGRPPLFCFHPVSGNVIRYFGLAKALGEEQPVHGLQSIGLCEPARAQDDIADMAALYTEEILRVRPTGPYRLIGYSMGGLIAHSVAGLLHRRTGEYPVVVLIDSDVRDLDGTDPDAVVAISVLKERVDGSVLRGLDRASAVRVLHRMGVERGIFDAAFPMERLEAIHDTIRANALSMRGHTPGPYAGPLTVFSCERPSDLGWAPYGGELTRHVLPGNHYVAMEPEGTARIAAALADQLTA